MGERRGGGGEERVSDERRASLTVVLRGGEHQSQVIYSLPWPGPSPFFSLVVCVCKHGTKKKKNRMRARSALTPSAPRGYSPTPPLPPHRVCPPCIRIHYADARLILTQSTFHSFFFHACVFPSVLFSYLSTPSGPPSVKRSEMFFDG